MNEATTVLRREVANRLHKKKILCRGNVADERARKRGEDMSFASPLGRRGPIRWRRY